MFLKRAFARDRRRQKRQLVNASVSVFTESGRIEALGINLSDVGMCLFTVANLPIDSQIEVELPVPRSQERMRLSAVIRHKALYLYGIEFVDSDGSAGREAAERPQQIT
jgi:hypothetical protein